MRNARTVPAHPSRTEALRQFPFVNRSGRIAGRLKPRITLTAGIAPSDLHVVKGAAARGQAPAAAARPPQCPRCQVRPSPRQQLAPG